LHQWTRRSTTTRKGGEVAITKGANSLRGGEESSYMKRQPVEKDTGGVPKNEELRWRASPFQRKASKGRGRTSWRYGGETTTIFKPNEEFFDSAHFTLWKSVRGPKPKGGSEL